MPCQQIGQKADGYKRGAETEEARHPARAMPKQLTQTIPFPTDLQAFQRYIESLEPEELAAFLKANPWLPETMKRIADELELRYEIERARLEMERRKASGKGQRQCR